MEEIWKPEISGLNDTDPDSMGNTNINVASENLTSGRMFLGSSDDSVTRHPWDDMSTDTDALNKTLIYHALLGPRICSRLGNIIYHEPYLHALSENKSPLLPMCRSGFYQIHLRSESINRNIESRLEEGTNSTTRFKKYYDWRAGSQLYWRFENIDSQIVLGKGKIVYNPSFRGIFRKLAELCYERIPGEYSEAYKILIEKFDEKDRTRSNFEEVCIAHFSDPTAIARAMSVMNSINHYAYGIALSQHPASETNAFIETSELAAINALTKPLLSEISDQNDESLMDEVIRSQALDVVEKNLFVTTDIFRSPDKWRSLEPLLDIASSTADAEEFNELKKIAVLSIKRTILSGGDEDKKNLLRESCRNYSKFLNDRLKSKNDEQIPVFVKLRARSMNLANKVGDSTAGEFVGDAVELLGGGKPAKILVGALFSIGSRALSHHVSRNVGSWRSARRVRDGRRAADLRALDSCLSIRRMDPIALKGSGLLSP